MLPFLHKLYIARLVFFQKQIRPKGKGGGGGGDLFMVKTSSFLLSCVLIEDVIVIAYGLLANWGGGRGSLGYFLQVLQRENVCLICVNWCLIDGGDGFQQEV